MTTTKPTRRPTRRASGHRVGQVGLGRDGRSEVGEKLRDAREVRGVDLYRVERDTKIRYKYLAALEDGDFMDLPGDVYARGFLRNYATYLGLDADEMEEEWREEAGQATPVMPTIVGPQPITIRRGIRFQQSHMVIALVVVLVLVVTSYFGFQLTRYLSYPTLAVDSAGPSPVTVAIGTPYYVLTGTATAGTTVLIAWNGLDPKMVIADDSGRWTYQALLTSGSNQFDITAKNLDTSHASNTIKLVVFVPVATPPPAVPVVAFTLPADGASFADGKVNVTGTGTAVSSVTLTATYLGPPLAPGATLPPPTPTPPTASHAATTSPGASAGPSAGPSATPGPKPTSGGIEADGTFLLGAQLTPGLWQLTIVGTTATGAVTKPVSRTVTVPYKGINVLIQIKGGDAAVSFYHDGVVDDSGHSQADGWSATVVGSKVVCVNSVSNATRVYITVNGISYGPITSFGGHHAYIDTSGVPRDVSSC